MARPQPRELRVLRSHQITPHMRRITLGGEAMQSFPPDQQSAYVKLVFAQANQPRPLMRTYTIRAQREMEIDIDFVLHAEPGPASAWALQAQPGDRILVAGPGAKKLINADAESFLFVADMSALPALAVNLSQLPRAAHGHALIEVHSEADIQVLEHPPGITLHWLINPEPDPSGMTLAARAQQLPWPAGRVAVWAACEFNSMLRLRTYLKEVRKVPRSHLYISSYWQIGQSEDGHKQNKARDSESLAA